MLNCWSIPCCWMSYHSGSQWQRRQYVELEVVPTAALPQLCYLGPFLCKWLQSPLHYLAGESSITARGMPISYPSSGLRVQHVVSATKWRLTQNGSSQCTQGDRLPVQVTTGRAGGVGLFWQPIPPG